MWIHFLSGNMRDLHTPSVSSGQEFCCFFRTHFIKMFGYFGGLRYWVNKHLISNWQKWQTDRLQFLHFAWFAWFQRLLRNKSEWRAIRRHPDVESLVIIQKLFDITRGYYDQYRLCGKEKEHLAFAETLLFQLCPAFGGNRLQENQRGKEPSLAWLGAWNRREGSGCDCRHFAAWRKKNKMG